MSKYIKRSDIKDMLMQMVDKGLRLQKGGLEQKIIEKIADLPTIDIVRCKDCSSYTRGWRVCRGHKSL